MKDIQTSIYEIVHSAEARAYWEQKEKIVNPLFDWVQWDAVGQAMQSTPRTRRVFVSKHTVGMCGVGKYLYRWKQRSSDACPRCGDSEDTTHVWKCKGADADKVWDNAMIALEEWMVSVQTDPDVQEAIIAQLNNWRLGIDNTYTVPFQLQPAVDQQTDIGWNNFLEGWVSFEWELVQQAYYDLIQSRRTGLRWLSSLIKKLWQVAWDMWEHRNGILHAQDNCVSSATISSINKNLRSLYNRLQSIILSHADRYLTALPAHTLLAKDLTYKQAWIANAQLLVKCHRKAIRRSRRTMHGMKRCMWKWLIPRRRC